MAGEDVTPRQFLFGVVLVVALVTTLTVDATLVSPHAPDEPPRTVEDVSLVTPREDASKKLWPFTSRAHDFDSLTLPINVVFTENASFVRSVLARGDDESWNRTTDEWEVTDREGGSMVVRGTQVQWRETKGADRYVYVDTPGPGGEWRDETYQLHDGTYLGTRYHLRIYRGKTGPRAWTAVQAHHEHWDWFRLRHTVGSLARARHYVEREFYGESTLQHVERARFGNGGIADTDGWVTRIDLRTDAPPRELPLLGLLVVGGVLGRYRDRASIVDRLETTSPTDLRHVALFLWLVATMLFVRTGSVALEQSVLPQSPKLIAGTFYLLLVVGMPAGTFALSRSLDDGAAFVTAFLGLGFAVVADYWYMGVSVMPVNVVFHRLLLMCSLGLIAAGSSRWHGRDGRWSTTLAAGVLAWVLNLVWPLVGLL